MPDAALPPGTTHVFTKNHKTLGLDPSWSGPFPVMEQISRSQIRIKVGHAKDGKVRSEVRRLHDVKPAHVAEDTPDAERPRRGRKPRTSPLLQNSTPNSGSEPANGGEINNQQNESKQTENPPNSNVLADFNHPPRSNERPMRSTRNQNPNYRQG